MAIPHSAAFHAAMLSGAPYDVKAWITRQGRTVYGPRGIDLTGATIDFDEFAASRRVLKGKIPDPDGLLRPRFVTNTFSPYGNELVVQFGLDTTGTGVFEYVDLGIYRLIVTSTATDGTMDVQGLDRSYIQSSQSDETPHVIAAGTALDAAILAWAQQKQPDVQLLTDAGASAQIIGSTLVYDQNGDDDDPFANMSDLVTKFGRELFYDFKGRLWLRPIPNQTGGPYAGFYVPGEMNVAVASTVIMDGRNAKNVVRVIAEGSGVAASGSFVGSAEVTDPGDPMYAGQGTQVGRLVKTIRTPALTSQAQVDAAAAAELTKAKGVTQNTTLTIAPIVIHEPGDIVAYGSTIENIEGIYALSRWSLPLNMSSAPSIATRVLKQIGAST